MEITNLVNNAYNTIIMLPRLGAKGTLVEKNKFIVLPLKSSGSTGITRLSLVNQYHITNFYYSVPATGIILYSENRIFSFYNAM